jgi:glycosyltransferase involved in cell wall biosynthesis
LDALAILRRRRLNVRLRAIGSFEHESYRRELVERVRQLELEPWVDWTGFQSDINAQLQQLDLFVLPSLFGEGMPMVVLEAMAMGVPVIGTDVEGVPEAVRDGLDGRIARAGDASDLAQAIASVVCGPCCWMTLRQNALERQAQHFSDVAMARRVAAVYDQVLQSAAVSMTA